MSAVLLGRKQLNPLKSSALHSSSFIISLIALGEPALRQALGHIDSALRWLSSALFVTFPDDSVLHGGQNSLLSQDALAGLIHSPGSLLGVIYRKMKAAFSFLMHNQVSSLQT